MSALDTCRACFIQREVSERGSDSRDYEQSSGCEEYSRMFVRIFELRYFRLVFVFALVFQMLF